MAGRARIVALAAGFVLATAGCQYLYGFDATNPDDFALPKPLATYVEGEATIAIDGAPEVSLGTVSSGALLDDLYGSEATWTNADGWYVRIMGASNSPGMFGFGGSLTLDRVVDGAHWTTFDPGRCILTIETADAKGLRGRATCKDLRWSDALGGSFSSLEPDYIEGQDPFDAEVTFEARPSTTTPG